MSGMGEIQDDHRLPLLSSEIRRLAVSWLVTSVGQGLALEEGLNEL